MPLFGVYNWQNAEIYDYFLYTNIAGEAVRVTMVFDVETIEQALKKFREYHVWQPNAKFVGQIYEVSI